MDDIREHCNIPGSRTNSRSTNPNPSIRQHKYSDDTSSADMDARDSFGLDTSFYCRDRIQDEAWDGAYCKAPHNPLADNAARRDFLSGAKAAAYEAYQLALYLVLLSFVAEMMAVGAALRGLCLDRHLFVEEVVCDGLYRPGQMNYPS